MDEKLDIINPEDKDYADGKLWLVELWSGRGYSVSQLYVYAQSEEIALDTAIVYMEVNSIDGYLLDSDTVKSTVFEYYEEEYKEWLQDTNWVENNTESNWEDGWFDFAQDYLNYIYVDATMEGASQPWFIYGENFNIKQVEEEKETKTESATEEYWDATEIDRDGFIALLKFNFGTDANYNNYIVTVDGNEVKRFYAEDDEEAKSKYQTYKADYKNSDHGDLTMNVKSIASREESKKVEDCTQAGSVDAGKVDLVGTDKKDKIEEDNTQSEEHTIWDSEDNDEDYDMEDMKNLYQDYLNNYDNTVKPMSYEEWLDSDECQTYFDLEWNEVASDNSNYEDWYNFIDRYVSADEKQEAYNEYVANCEESTTEPEDFDTWFDNYRVDTWDDTWAYKEEDLDDNILSAMDTQINDNLLFLVGGYNSNYPDFRPSGNGGVLFTKGTDEFKSYMGDFDRVKITSTNGILGARLGDHDGAVSGQFYTLPDDITELVKALNYESIVKDRYDEEDLEKYNLQDLMETEFNNDIYYNNLDEQDLLNNIDLLKPIEDTISGYGQPKQEESKKVAESEDEVKEWGKYYVVVHNAEGTDIDTVGFDSEDEACKYAEEELKKHNDCEYDVYYTETDECLYIYDKEALNESIQSTADLVTKSKEAIKNNKDLDTIKVELETAIDKAKQEDDKSSVQLLTSILETIKDKQQDKDIERESKENTYYYEIHFKFNEDDEDPEGYSKFFKADKEVTDKEDIIELAKQHNELDEDDLADIDSIDYATEIDKEEYQKANKVEESEKRQIAEIEQDIEDREKQGTIKGISEDDIVEGFEQYIKERGVSTECIEDAINDYFTDLFYDIEDENDLDTINNAEHTIRAKYNLLKEDVNTDSKYKQVFIDYCKGKVEDLGEMKLADTEDGFYEESYPIIFIEPKFRDAQPAYALQLPEGNLFITDKDGNVIFNGNAMASAEEEVIEMQFTKISTDYYNELLQYWDEIGFDEALELKDITTTSTDKINKEFKVPAHFKYNVFDRMGGADVEVYCTDRNDLKATTTTMNEKGEYVQDYFDIDGLWEVSEVDENGKWVKNQYITGWQNAMASLEQQYNKLQGNKTVKEEANAEEFVKQIDKMKDYGIWDGKDDTYADAKKKLDDIEKVDKQLNDEKLHLMYVVEYYDNEKDANVISKTLERKGYQTRIERMGENEWAVWSTYEPVNK